MIELEISEWPCGHISTTFSLLFQTLFLLMVKWFHVSKFKIASLIDGLQVKMSIKFEVFPEIPLSVCFCVNG